MSRYWPLLLLLASVWGASYLFIKVAVDGGLGVLRGHVRTLVLLGGLNNALPFWLLGFAETRIDSGLTAVIQAAAPVFTVVLAAWIDRSQRVRGARLAGIGVGFLGVVLLVGIQEGGQLVGALAVIGTAACYAVSVLIAGRTVRSLPPLQVSIGQLAAGALIIAPFGLAQAPSEPPSAGAIAAVVALGALGSGIAYLLYFAIIASAGASRAILVTYLVPAFALAYGALFLDEVITATALAGLALVLAGTALATGLVRARSSSVRA